MIIAALYRLISLATFPGIILHEWSHKLFCQKLGVPVQKVCYFRLGSPAGYVIHGHIDHFGKALIIATAPLLINTTAAMLAFALALKMSPYASLSLILIWFGTSLAMHSFPSTQDMETLHWEARRSWIRSPLAAASLPALWMARVLRPRDTILPGLVYAMLILAFTAFLVKAKNLLC